MSACRRTLCRCEAQAEWEFLTHVIRPPRFHGFRTLTTHIAASRLHSNLFFTTVAERPRAWKTLHDNAAANFGQFSQLLGVVLGNHTLKRVGDAGLPVNRQFPQERDRPAVLDSRHGPAGWHRILHTVIACA